MGGGTMARFIGDGVGQDEPEAEERVGALPTQIVEEPKESANWGHFVTR